MILVLSVKSILRCHTGEDVVCQKIQEPLTKDEKQCSRIRINMKKVHICLHCVILIEMNICKHDQNLVVPKDSEGHWQFDL